MTRWQWVVALSSALMGVATPAKTDNLDVSIITVKKFTVLDAGGLNMPSGIDSYYDFLEIINNDNSPLPIIITGVDGLGIDNKGCILTEGTKFPISLPYKTTLEFTIRQGCRIAGVAINVDGGGVSKIRQQRYLITGSLMRLATPVFLVHLQRSN